MAPPLQSALVFASLVDITLSDGGRILGEGLTAVTCVASLLRDLSV
ncbi:oxidoreductase [Palleronia caenipelagi]|uniref:Oxidoreductase n=1 Tax=Palleronia caenipelagi TaxID=2489174 RepID=A0A547Q0F2_9RHOB|nr:oxidoreductase [Palleronia caenipelagi]